MPVYNGERFLAEALESILGQTYPDLELIISDNASEDGTEAICRRFAAQDERIKYCRSDQNLGAAKNFNRVFELSSGDYFKWAAADDLCASTYVERCVEILDREPNIVLCYGKTKIIDETGKTTESYEDGLNLISPSAGGRFLQVMFNVGMCNAVNGVIRSSVLRNTRLIGNYVASDKCLLAELSLWGKFRELPEYLFFRRVHSDASSAHKDNASQLEFFDPQLSDRFVFQSWRHFFENLMAVKRAPAKTSQKVLPFLFLLGGLVVNPKPYLRELVMATKHIMRPPAKKSASKKHSLLTDRQNVRAVPNE